MRKTLMIVLLLASGLSAAAAADRVSARYSVSFMRLPIGRAELKAMSTAEDYRIDLAARITGLAALFAGGHGEASASGRMTGGKPVVSHFDISIHSKNKMERVELAFSEGRIREIRGSPERPIAPDVEPVTPAHLSGGIVDPLTAALFVPQSAAAPLAPSTCERRAKVFDTERRFDLIFSYARTEMLEIAGYKGAALVCAIRFEPVAGYAMARRDIVAMRQRVSEVTLAPVKGGRTLLPVRIAIPFVLGRGIAEATMVDFGD